jgi:hypothetical protein
MQKAVYIVARQKHLQFAGHDRDHLASQAARMIAEETRDGCPITGGGKYHVPTYLIGGFQWRPPMTASHIANIGKEVGLSQEQIDEAILANEQNPKTDRYVMKWAKIELDDDQWLSQKRFPVTLGEIARDTAEILNGMGFEDHGLDWVDS